MTLPDPDRPFVLLDDARQAGAGPARLFQDMKGSIVARNVAEVGPALDAIRAASADGLHVAGYMSYEAGYGLEDRLRDLAPAEPGWPLIWFGLFARCDLLAPDVVADLLPGPSGAWAGAPVPRTGQVGFEALVGEVQQLIAAGDLYQANLSFRADVPFEGCPLSLYARLRSTSRAGWGSIVRDEEGNVLLSLSPELFFELRGRAIMARPMKGTAPAGSRPDELHGDIKQRAENLMIVDLIRNDLSRVAEPGSVRVPALFDVESYPTVQQMTSTVTAVLSQDRDAVDTLRALFPCGSITGAPKIRAMEALAGLEADERGPYTGSIGFISPDGEAAFNVAIRTLMIKSGADRAVLGLGAGIVADSRPADEWRECLSKGAFVTAEQQSFDLIETMRFDRIDGLVRLEHHLARLKASADALGFRFDRHGLRNELQAATFRLRADRRVRVRLARSGIAVVEVRPLPSNPELVEVSLAPQPVSAADFRLAHKTSSRRFYDDMRIASGMLELLMVDPDGFLTEGTFTNIFVEQGDLLLTPPLTRGVLPGVLRAWLIEEGRAVEADLRPDDLSGGFFLGNSLRGLIPARLVAGGKLTGL